MGDLSTLGLHFNPRSSPGVGVDVTISETGLHLYIKLELWAESSVPT